MIGSTTRADLRGLVLAVGVDRDDHLSAASTREPVTESQCRALTAVDRDVADERSGRNRGLGGGPVLRSVDDDDDLGGEARGLARGSPG